MSVRFRCCLIAWIAVLILTMTSRHGFAQDATLILEPVDSASGPATANISDDEWVMDIQPATGGTPDPETKASDYVRIYNSIPFSRVEFSRNPTYRHDAAMEILTGNSRHMTVVRHDPPVSVTARPAAASTYPRDTSPYGSLRRATRLNGYFPPNGYRYIPSLNPFRNIMSFGGATGASVLLRLP